MSCNSTFACNIYKGTAATLKSPIGTYPASYQHLGPVQSIPLWSCFGKFSFEGDRGEQVAGQSVKGEYTLIDKVREKYFFLAIFFINLFKCKYTIFSPCG